MIKVLADIKFVLSIQMQHINVSNQHVLLLKLSQCYMSNIFQLKEKIIEIDIKAKEKM